MKAYVLLVILFLFGVGSFVAIPSAKEVKQPFHCSQLDGTVPASFLSFQDSTAEYGSIPIPQRGEEFRRFLAPSVKIDLGIDGSGSGTICYYDPEKNLAYVATCGHLWDHGTMDEHQGLKKNLTCTIVAFYHNEVKLAAPKKYPAKVIFYSYVRGCDTGLVTFQPDWVPDYFPIAAVDYPIKEGQRYHSCGCDNGDEVAHYDIEIVGMYPPDLVTKDNSPRPGRSGGGLFSDDGYYIGTCWGTQPRDGTGVGYFTPLLVIHQHWNLQPNYKFLLNIDLLVPAQTLPVIDRSAEQQKYNKTYILSPRLR